MLNHLVFFLQIIHSSLLIFSDVKSIDHPRNSRKFASSVLYVISYGLFFGLGKLHMTSTCLVIAWYQLIIYLVFIGYVLVIH